MPVYAVIPIGVMAIIDAGTASSSPFQRLTKIVHDHAGIVFTFNWNLCSRCAGNREHHAPSCSAAHDGAHAQLPVMRSRMCLSRKGSGKTISYCA
jgi:hypothetical protein